MHEGRRSNKWNQGMEALLPFVMKTSGPAISETSGYTSKKNIKGERVERKRWSK